MAKARVGVGLVVGCLLGVAAPAWAAPSVEQMLQYRPKQEGVDCTTPNKDQYSLCEVKLVGGTRPGSSGWLLLDAKRLPVRRFFDSDGDKKIDVWSYYKEGVEVYREVNTKATGRPNEYRWLNTGGMKWGVDLDGDGKIDTWRMISVEEAALELFQATVAHDGARLQALLVTDADLRSLRLPASQVDGILEKVKRAPAKMQATAASLPPPSSGSIPRPDSAAPQCWPADAAGSDRDLFKATPGVLYEADKDKGAEKSSTMMQAGEMIQVGLAWKVIDGPSLPTDIIGSPELQKLQEALAKVDDAGAKMWPTPPAPGPNPAFEEYHLKRVELLEKIAEKVSPAEREVWIKQIADSLSPAALHAAAGSTSSFQKLQQMKDQVVKDQPTGNLAGYLTFRVLWTEYSPKISGYDGKPVDLPKTQAEWLEKLANFVQSFPRADDTADALGQLGMGCEFAGKDEEAKRWYTQLATNFAEHPMAAKAKGAATRLDLVGHPMELAGKTSTGTDFNLASLKGKVVAVYYWATYCRDKEREMTALKDLQTKLGAKGFEVVTVSLDDAPEAAVECLQKAALPGTHLIQPAGEAGGMGGPLAVQYGIMGLPNLFLVGKDGKTISRTVTVNDLEAAVQKAL